MHCPNCDLMVATERALTTDPEEARRYRRWFDADDVDGDYDIDEVGSVVEDDHGTKWMVRLRVDICANCAVPLQARTHLVRDR